MRYRSKLPNEAHLGLSAFNLPPDQLAALGAQLGERYRLVVQPGEEFDAPAGLNHPLLEPIDDEAKAYAAEVAEQDQAHARAYHEQRGASAGRPTPEFPQLEQPPVPQEPPPSRRASKEAKE